MQDFYAVCTYNLLICCTFSCLFLSINRFTGCCLREMWTVLSVLLTTFLFSHTNLTLANFKSYRFIKEIVFLLYQHLHYLLLSRFYEISADVSNWFFFLRITRTEGHPSTYCMSFGVSLKSCIWFKFLGSKSYFIQECLLFKGLLW